MVVAGELVAAADGFPGYSVVLSSRAEDSCCAHMARFSFSHDGSRGWESSLPWRPSR